MLLPKDFPFTIYEMSSWARSSTVPLLIVFDKKPIFSVNPKINLDELYAEGIKNASFELPRQYDITDLFLGLDKAFKFAENFNSHTWKFLFNYHIYNVSRLMGLAKINLLKKEDIYDK